MGGHFTRLGTQLTGAVRAYNETVASMETRVLVTARKLTELKVSDDDLDAPTPLEVVTRRPQAAELLASASEALVVLEPGRGDVAAADPVELDERFGVNASRAGDGQPPAVAGR